MTAEARVVRAAPAYLGFETNVRSPGPARSIPLSPVISVSGDPFSRRALRAEAMAESFIDDDRTPTRICLDQAVDTSSCAASFASTSRSLLYLHRQLSAVGNRPNGRGHVRGEEPGRSAGHNIEAHGRRRTSTRRGIRDDHWVLTRGGDVARPKCDL